MRKEMLKKKVLVVEDSAQYQVIIDSVLKEEYHLTFTCNAADTFRKISEHQYDLILLDVVLPDQDGFQICSMIRGNESTKHVPIIFVTAKEDVPDKVLGFSLGADDYVTKPFNALELRARVGAKIRSQMASIESSECLVRGQIEINVPAQRVFLRGDKDAKTPLELTTTEFKLLVFFCSHVDNVLSRDQILNEIWGDKLNVTERTVDTHISKLRKKLAECGSYIQSVHGSGYRFVVKVSEQQVA